MNEIYNEFLDYLKYLGIYDEKFISFLDGKVHRFSLYITLYKKFFNINNTSEASA